ncbi:hypothetical protein ACFFX0_25370 [Citricoccus parietis]|uniref:Uncharacterized protein n=1 Tax=Citricoccus parietis TaxID=592307 RepID=A0ABV5G5X5_9MICC
MAARLRPVRLTDWTDEGGCYDPSREFNAGDLPEGRGEHRPAEAGRMHPGLF